MNYMGIAVIEATNTRGFVAYVGPDPVAALTAAEAYVTLMHTVGQHYKSIVLQAELYTP
jgi:hypothetical protein